MKRREFLLTSAAAFAAAHQTTAAADGRGAGDGQARVGAATRKILIAGGGFNTAFIRYLAELTGKPRPKLLYLPTASGDSPQGIIGWYQNCSPLAVEASHQISFIASARQNRSWEDVFLSVDGIVCSGGNTLNQQAIWKAQGLDQILKPPGTAASSLAARAPGRCAGSRRGRRIRGRRN